MLKQAFHSGKDTGCHFGQRLSFFHDSEIEIRNKSEYLKDLFNHLPVLSGKADFDFTFRAPLKFGDDRSHFDGFRSCSENNKNFIHSFPLRNDSPRAVDAAADLIPLELVRSVQ